MFKADGVLSGETENYFLLRKRDTYLFAMRQSHTRCQIYGTADTSSKRHAEKYVLCVSSKKGQSCEGKLHP